MGFGYVLASKILFKIVIKIEYHYYNYFLKMDLQNFLYYYLFADFY